MPTVTGIGLALTIDVLTRVSLVLTAGLLLSHAARRDAALRHAILVAGLAGAFTMPAAMLIARLLPVSRWQLGLLGGEGLDDSVAVDVVGSRPQSDPRHRASSLDHPAPSIVARRRNEARVPGARCVRAVN